MKMTDWFPDAWRGKEVNPIVCPQIVGKILGPWQHENWIQIGWTQGVKQPMNWHISELQFSDGKVLMAEITGDLNNGIQ